MRIKNHDSRAAQRCCKRTEFSSLKTSWSAVVASPNSCSWWKRSPRAPDVSCTELDPVSVSLQTFKILDLEEHAKEKLRLSDNLIVVAWTISVNTRKSVDSLLELTLISSNVFPFVSISSCSTSTFCGSEKVTKETSSNMLSPFGNLCDQSRNAWHGFSWRGSSDWRTVRAWSPGVRAPKIHNRSTDACSWTTDTSISSENATIGTKFADLYLTLSSTFHQWWRLRSRNDREPCINIIVTKKRPSTLPFLWRSWWQRSLSILWWLLRSCSSLKEMRHCPQWIVDLHCGNLIEMRELPLELFRLVVRRNVYRPCNKFHVHFNTLRNFQIVRTSKPSGFDNVVHFVVPKMWHFEKKTLRAQDNRICLAKLILTNRCLLNLCHWDGWRPCRKCERNLFGKTAKQACGMAQTFAMLDGSSREEEEIGELNVDEKKRDQEKAKHDNRSWRWLFLRKHTKRCNIHAGTTREKMFARVKRARCGVITMSCKRNSLYEI